MVGKRRSGLANDRRAYKCTTRCPPTYTVIYQANGSTSGQAPNDRYSYKVGSIVTVLGNTGSLVKSGHAFVGWNTAADGSETSYSPGATFPINENTTLYAKWTPTYTVTYLPNGSTSGTAPAISSYAAGSTVTVLGNTGSLAKTGSTFSGWNIQPDGSGTNYSQGNTFTINANTPLYAEWTPASIPLPPTALSSVGGDQEAYILFTQVGTVTNYEYSTDDGDTFVAFDPPQIYSPVNIKTLSLNGGPLTNGTTYTVRLKAVNSGASSDPSASVTVVPTGTSLLSAGRLIYLDANNTSSYSGSGTAWTNLVSSGSYSASLNGSPTFNNSTEPGNKYFQFNPGAATGQFAQINQNAAINPVINQPFTIQMWVRINNVGLQGGNLVSKVFGSPSWDGYALYYKTDTTLELHENVGLVSYYPSVAGVLSSGWALYTANIQFGNGGGRQNKIFVNGRQVMTATSAETSAGASNQNLTFPAGFGGDGECDIGEFYYYDTELTQTQIIQNFDATKSRYNV